MAVVWQTILTIFYVVWLFAVLLFLYVIWRNGAKRARLMDQTRIDASMQSANAAKVAADAAQKAADVAHRLAAYLEGHLPLS